MSQPPKEYEGRIADVRDAAPGIRILHVALAGGEKLDFQAGQYVFLEAAACAPRAFSIASSPDEDMLEFHIRDSGGGFSALAAEALRPGAAVTVKGPFGANVWRSGGEPLLALAGGIGIAPLRSILAAHLRAPSPARARLYWGARDARQLYLHDYFLDLAKTHPCFDYIPVLSDEKPADGFRAGLVADAVAADFGDLSAFGIHMAGPMAMIEATLPVLLQKGAARDRIFSDAFSV